jgi:hypothetical protein
MSDVAVRYLGGSTEVYIAAAGLTATRGGTVQVPADVAGHEPGPWRPRAPEDPQEWPTRLAADGSTVQTHDPGAGLLAQSEVWARAEGATKRPASTTTLTDTPQEK